MQNKPTSKINNLGNETKNDRGCQNLEISEKQRKPVDSQISPQANQRLCYSPWKDFSFITNSRISNEGWCIGHKLKIRGILALVSWISAR